MGSLPLAASALSRCTFRSCSRPAYALPARASAGIWDAPARRSDLLYQARWSASLARCRWLRSPSPASTSSALSRSGSVPRPVACRSRISAGTMSTLGPILIVGGGIGGLTLAAALHRCGLDATVVERNAHWDPIGGGIAVQPNAMRVLQRLGIAADVKQAGAVIRRWLFRDQVGNVLCDIALEPLWGDVGPFIGIERTKLHDALKSGVRSCRLGTAVPSLIGPEH